MEQQGLSFDDIQKALAKKPDKRNHKPNPWNEGREYLEIQLIQDTLDKIFPVRDEHVVNETIVGNSINISIRLTTPMGSRDGMGSSVVRIDSQGIPVGTSIIEARRIARSMALKNAAASFGRVFGRDLNRDREEDAFKVPVVND